ncbi:phenylacetate--CoA ligase family protein [Streptomyces sp. NPDC001674]|uniref:phenylacetate--CoA ligase family protein n=1 Tax=Streptomyces sp. NPDC001674 TaxID=3154394 RepID=UPI0033225370
MTPRHHPTDLLIAVGRAQADLAGGPGTPPAALLRTAGLESLSALFDEDELTEGLDELLDGLAQYPWQPVVDSDDVYTYEPSGTIVVDDADRPDAALRALLLGWAFGNDVVIRAGHERRRAFWRDLAALLHGYGSPLPAARVVPAGTPAAGVPVHVPAPVQAPSAAGAPAGASVWRQDCRSDWVTALRTRTYLRGTTLARARAAEDPAATGRLDARLRYLVHRARRAPYYRDLPPVSGLADLPHLGILEKEALTRHTPPTGRGLAGGARPSGEVLRSGATTGTPRYIVYGRADWNNMVREAIPLFWAMGLRPGDRLVNTLFGGDLYGGLTTTLTEFTRMPVECYTTAQSVTAASLLALVQGFWVNALIGVPALIMPLLREAYALDPGLRLEKILYLGTALSPQDRSWLRAHLGTRTISSVLAVNDGAQLGYQCAELGGALHHVNDDFNHLEAVDEHGVPVPEGRAGDLLVTTFQKFEAPLIRYRVGDRGRLFHHDCACGVSGRVLEYHGRADGVIRAAGQVVLHAELEAELSALGVSRVQAEISSRSGREVLTVRTESPSRPDPAAVRERLERAFPALGASRPFDQALDAFELRVECLAEGVLPRSPVSGKVRPVVDLRLAPA